VGIFLIPLIDWLAFGQSLDAPVVAGMALIVAGVLLINVLSKSAAP